MLVQHILCEHIWLNCAFNDTSITFGTLLEYTSFLVIFGYRSIAELTCDKIDSHFTTWPPSESSRLEKFFLSGGNVVHSCFQWILALYGVIIKNQMGVVTKLLAILRNLRWLPFH